MLRKILIALIVLLGATWIITTVRASSLDPMFHARFDKNPKLSFNEASQIALYLNSLTDKLPEEKLEVSEEAVYALALEILPNFQYEGAVDDVRFPTDFNFRVYGNGEQHNHILGQSNCEEFVINARYANPFSTLYNDPDWIQTVIHEMVHVQQGHLCLDKRVTRENIENTAELVTWEVMAAQVNRGNFVFLRPLLDSMKGRMMGVAWLTAMEEGRLDDYNKLVVQISNGPTDIARSKKSQRFWANDMTDLKFILNAYGRQPFERLLVVMKKDHKMEGLALPDTRSGTWKMVPRVFIFDDLAYFLLNANEIVKEAQNVHKEPAFSN